MSCHILLANVLCKTYDFQSLLNFRITHKGIVDLHYVWVLAPNRSVFHMCQATR